MDIKIFSLKDDLEKVASEINNAAWDAANEIPEYTATALKAYLLREDTIFLACYETTRNRSTLLGIASSRIEIKPYGEELWLYVDEIDVCADQRQKGVGKFIMQKLLEIATKQECEEVWLGAEAENRAANALYRSLNPDEITDVVGYTYETEN
ncbi:hypothetical protein NBRC116493_04650 [Aurantivibrio infirmus]